MHVAQRSPVPVGIVRSRSRRGAYALCLKTTYDMVGGPRAERSVEQAPLRAVARDGAGILLYPGDFAEERDACDVVLAGDVLLAEGPVIAKIGPLTLRSHRAELLGPVEDVENDRLGSFARPDSRMPYPSFPLHVEVQGGGWFRSATIDAPRPMAALVIGGDWESPLPLALQIDGVTVDPFASRIEVVMRAYFQHPGDVDRDITAIVDVTASLPRTTSAERASWERVPAVEPEASELSELVREETIPALVLEAVPDTFDTWMPPPLEEAPPEPDPSPPVRPPLMTLPDDGGSSQSEVDDSLPFARARARTAPADPRRIPVNPLPFVKPPPPAPPPPNEPPRTLPPPPPAASAALPFGPSRQKAITIAPPPSRAEPLPFRAPTSQARPILPAATPAFPPPAALPFPAVVALQPSTVPASPAPQQARIEGLTLDEYATIRASLWAGGATRKETLKQHGLSELRWRAVERRWERHLDEAGPDAFAPLLDLLAAASRRDAVANR